MNQWQSIQVTPVPHGMFLSTQDLTTPSGIDMIENRLIVSDYATGDIVIYSTQAQQVLN